MVEEVSLYIHVPFCTRKCSYCSFYVLRYDSALVALFLEALKKEIALYKPLWSQKKLVSIYFGGGTPSLLPSEAIQSILEDLAPLGNDLEITLEANPENVGLEQFKEFRSLGINRISLGVQSFDDSLLNFLTRRHSSHEAQEAVLAASQAGFENISIDLMYDIPNQTLSAFESTLQQALMLPISHLSLYNLTFEPNTPFHRREKALRPLLPQETISTEMLSRAIDCLEGAGWSRYEISAFAKSPSTISRHNLGYWIGRPFLGLGPSAHSFWQGNRFSNLSNLREYHQKLQAGQLPIESYDTISLQARQKELLAIRLRTFLPYRISDQALPCETQKTLEEFAKKGWLHQQGDTLQLTQEGARFYDTMAIELVE